MKLSCALLALGATTVAAGFGFSKQQPLGDVVAKENDVPGENPLEFCEDTEDYILEIKNVDLDPNPPAAGTKLTIEAKGNFSEEVEEGAYALLEVKYGIIKLLTLKEDLCEQLKNVDKECPIKEGETTLTRDVDLPDRIPPGTYSVKADVYTKDDRKITCLTSKITFE